MAASVRTTIRQCRGKSRAWAGQMGVRAGEFISGTRSTRRTQSCDRTMARRTSAPAPIHRHAHGGIAIACVDPDAGSAPIAGAPIYPRRTRSGKQDRWPPTACGSHARHGDTLRARDDGIGAGRSSPCMVRSPRLLRRVDWCTLMKFLRHDTICPAHAAAIFRDIGDRRSEPRPPLSPRRCHIYPALACERRGAGKEWRQEATSERHGFHLPTRLIVR